MRTAFLALSLVACGFGDSAVDGIPDEAPAPPAAPAPLPDVTDAEIFRGAPAGQAAARSEGDPARRGVPSAFGVGGAGAPTFGGGGTGVGGAALDDAPPCKPPGVKVPDVVVTELDKPDLEERLFGTTAAATKVTDKPCKPAGIVVPVGGR